MQGLFSVCNSDQQNGWFECYVSLRSRDFFFFFSPPREEVERKTAAKRIPLSYMGRAIATIRLEPRVIDVLTHVRWD